MSENSFMIPLVAVIEESEADAAAMRRFIIESEKARLVGIARSDAEIPAVMAAEPDIVILGVKPGDDVAARIHSIHDYSPRCQIVLAIEPTGSLDVSRAMRAGARGIVTKPVSMTELVETIHEVVVVELRRLNRIEEIAKARAFQKTSGDVITVLSAKGGVGCTVLASNLAIALTNITKSRVALADFSLQFGDISVLLNLHSTHGVHELMRNIDELDNAILEDVMLRHQSGLRVLLPPPTLDQVEEVDTAGLITVIKALRKYYEYIVVDTWHSVEDATLALMDLSNVLLLVTTPEVPALRNTRRLLDLIRERPDLRSKVQIVVNRFPSKSAVSMRDIEASLGTRPVGTIPSDGRLITSAINEGVSFLNTRSAASRSVMQIAEALAQTRIAKQKKTAERPIGAPQPQPQ